MSNAMGQMCCVMLTEQDGSNA
jgi:probable HAF family extracellular repeat protein